MSAPQFSSVQEQALHLLSQRSLGAGFLFAPDTFDGNKEPADLAWVCEKIALLVYCTESRASFEKCVRHNLKQARKWLSKWHGERRLRGTNPHRTFDIAREDIETIIVLSVVGGAPDNAGAIHHAEAASLAAGGVRAAGTIPASLFMQIAQAGGSICDFIHALQAIAIDGGHVPEAVLLSKFQAHLSAIAGGLQIPEMLQSDNQLADFMLTITSAVRGMNYSSGSAEPEIAITWCDISLPGHLWLAARAHQAIKSIEAVPLGQIGPAVVSSKHKDGDYSLHVLVARGTDRLRQAADELLRSPDLQGGHAGFLIAIEGGMRIPLLISSRSHELANARAQLEALSRLPL